MNGMEQRDIWNKMEALRYIPDATTLDYDPDACVGCGMCAIVCPHGVFALNDKKAKVVDRDACMECGACTTNCPTGAISVSPGVG